MQNILFNFSHILVDFDLFYLAAKGGICKHPREWHFKLGLGHFNLFLQIFKNGCGFLIRFAELQTQVWISEQMFKFR